MSGYKVNDLMYVVYWRNSSKDKWSISQPVTLGEIIDDAELDFGDDEENGGSLPLHDIEWGHDEVLFYPVPPRKYSEQPTQSSPLLDGEKGE